MRKVRAVALIPLTVAAFVAMLMVAAPVALRAQAVDDAAAKNTVQARTVLDAMVQALGGDAWLNMKNQLREGRLAAFYQGKPTGSITKYWEFHAWPDSDRIEFTVHRDVVQFYLGRQGWEVTYKGKAALPQDQVDDYLRRRDHSVETALKTWLKDPQTILVYEGQHLAARHLADQVTLISPQNESVTILADTQTHLPLRRVFQWRDPTYKDKNTDAEEYDGYRTVDGIPTPFTITRFKNDDMVSQRFIVHASYNQQLDANIWSVDDTTKRIKK
jgi:hypothetical protein